MLKKCSKTFAEQLKEVRQTNQGTDMSKKAAFSSLVNSTGLFLEYLKIQDRTNEPYEPVRDAYHDLTDACPSSGPGCDDCFASTKFLESHIKIWDYVSNEAPEDSPQQACVCSALRELCDESLDLPKLKELHCLLSETDKGSATEETPVSDPTPQPENTQGEASQ